MKPIVRLHDKVYIIGQDKLDSLLRMIWSAWDKGLQFELGNVIFQEEEDK
jgi:hypothetical protein